MHIKSFSGGNLWSLRNLSPEKNAVVVTINKCCNRNGDAIMGAGIAKEAANRFPALPVLLGESLRDYPSSNVFYWRPGNLLLFATKDNWKNPSTLEIIVKSLQEIKGMLLNKHRTKFFNILMPRIGCGLGGLEWTDVRPLVTNTFNSIHTPDELWLVE